MTITFFGHSDAPTSIRPLLQRLLERLIVEEGADRFYVGNHGAFDALVRQCLKAAKQEYPHIDYGIVLAYLTHTNDHHIPSVYPEGLECVPPRFAICKRNEWMIESSDLVIVYVTRQFGGAARFKEMAERKGRRIINLADCQ